MAFPPNFRIDPRVATLAVSRTADDTCIAARLKYIGGKFPVSHADPSVEITGNDLKLYTSYDATQVLDTSLGDSDSGIFDLTDTPNDTFGELAALINASDNWRMTLVGALASDYVYASDLKVKTITGGSAAGDKVVDEDGANIYFNTTNAKKATVSVGLEEQDSAWGSFAVRRMDKTVPEGMTDISDYPDEPIPQEPMDRAAFLSQIIANQGSCTAGVVNVYGATQTTSRLLQAAIAQSTGAEQTTNFADPIFSAPGERIVVVLSGSAIGTPTLKVRGGWGDFRP